MATAEPAVAQVFAKFLSFHCPQAKLLLAQCLRLQPDAGTRCEQPGDDPRRSETQLAESAEVGGNQHGAANEENNGMLFVETLAGTQVATVHLAAGYGLDDVAKVVEEKHPDIPALKQRFFIAEEQVLSCDDGALSAGESTQGDRTAGQAKFDSDGSADGLVAALDEHVRAGVTLFLVINTSQRAALEVLFHALNGDRWEQNTLWRSQRPISDWQGVTTNKAGEVVRIDLNENGLGGTLPHSPAVWESLSTIEELYLGRNHIGGRIPPAMAKLRNLEWLRLDHNQLSGCIPREFAELAETLTDISYVDFSNNPNMLWPILKGGRWQWERRVDDPAFFNRATFKALAMDLLQAVAATAGGVGGVGGTAAASTALSADSLVPRPTRK